MKLRIKTSLSGILSSILITGAVQAIEVCHVANAGFLLKGKDASVLIDGLMVEDHYDGRFALPSHEMHDQIINRTDLFENLSVVASTHRHGDHFDPNATLELLRTNIEVSFVYPEDTLATLTESGLTDEEAKRITAVPDNQRSSYSYGDISVETYDVDHGPNMPQNVGYRITIDGVSVFHTGDINASREQLSSNGLNTNPVDVLLIPFWYGLNDDTQRAAIDETWAYKTIVPTHFSAKAAPWMEQFGGFGQLKETVAKTYPNAVIIAEEGQCVTFEASN